MLIYSFKKDIHMSRYTVQDIGYSSYIEMVMIREFMKSWKSDGKKLYRLYRDSKGSLISFDTEIKRLKKLKMAYKYFKGRDDTNIMSLMHSLSTAESSDFKSYLKIIFKYRYELDT